MKRTTNKWVAVLLACVMILAMIPAGTFGVQAEGNTFYVSTTAGSGTADGSEANPFTTFAAAVAVLQPGDTLIVKPGDYAEALCLVDITGSAQAPINIKGLDEVNVTSSVAVSALNGWKVALGVARSQYINISNINFTPAACDYTFSMYNTSNIKFQGCTFDGANSANSCAKIFEPDTNIVFDGNRFSSTTVFDGFGFDHSTFTNNIFTGWAAFYWTGTAATYCTVSNNLFDCDMVENSPGFYYSTITNNIIRGYSDVVEYGKENICANNCTSNSGEWYTTSGTDVVVSDPSTIFVSYPSDYHLKAGSPCADAGSSIGIPEYDYDGNLRFGPADIGPYTYASAVYIDASAPAGGDGKSENTAYNTIAAAAAEILPGMTVFIKPGSYTGNIAITGTGATDTKEITIQKLGVGIVSINGGASSAITIENAANVNISGLNLSCSAASYAPALKLDGALNCKITDSTFDVATFGIEITGNTSGCDIYNNTLTGTEKGIYLRDSSNNKIYNNIFYSYKCILNEDGCFTNTLIMNNVFTSHWGDGTIILNGTSTNLNGDTGNTIANNIISADCADPIRVGANAAGFFDAANNNIVDYNLYDSTSTAAKPANEVNSVLGDPLFVDSASGDFHLQFGSAAINRGTDVNAPALDRGGNIRFGKTDIGAYEYAGDSSAFYVMNQAPQGNIVNIDSTIDITFSEKTSAANNNLINNILVTANVDGNAVNVDGTFATADDAAGGSVITFTPANNFFYGTAYTVSIKKELISDNGNYLPVDASWTFTTESFITSEYYIAPNGSDSNTGTIESPKKSVTSSLIAGLKPGDTIYFREGSYNGIMVLQLKAGTEEKPITIKSYNNEKVILTSDNSDYILYLGHCQHINIEGLTFAPNAAQNGSRGVAMYVDNHTAGYPQSGDLKITNCRFENCGSAISTRDLKDVGFGNFEYSNNTIISNDGWGLYFQEVREIEGCQGKIFNNVIYGAHYSINLWGRSKNLLFYNNTFADTYDAEGGSGRYDIYPSQGSYTPDVNPVNISTDLVFKNNIFTKPIRTQLESGKCIMDLSQNCVFDNNVYSINGTDKVTFNGGGGGPVVTLDQLKTGTAWANQGRPLEVNGVSGIVTFANVANDARIILSTNPAIGVAADEVATGVASPATDINGNLRTKNEAGAFAFDETFVFVGANTGTADGSPSKPYPSITAAVNAGGKTIQMLAGTYSADENIDMTASAGTGDVTVMPYNDEVTLSGKVSINGSAEKAINLKKLTLAGDVDLTGAGITIDGCNVEGSAVLNAADGAIITNSIFAPKAADAISLIDSTNCMITNNIITERQTAVKFNTASATNKLYNNTFYGNVNDIDLSAGSVGNTFKNNIFSTNITYRTGNTFDYNLYNSDTIAQADLAAITSDVEANAVKATPEFINVKAKDYRIYRLSACAGAGVMEAGTPAKDINGLTRSTPPDIGAYAVAAIEVNYYVDGNTGDDTNSGIITSPFRTIGAAINALRNGEGIIVKEGTYNEGITLTDRAGDNYGDYVITADGVVILNGAVTLNNSTGVTIKGFTVNAGAGNTAVSLNASPKAGLVSLVIADTQTGVKAIASPDLNVDMVTIKNVEYGFVLDGSNSACPAEIFQSKVDNASVAAIDAKNLVSLSLSSSIIINSVKGVLGTGEASFIIVNNTFYNNSGYSIDISQNDGHATQLDILNNIFSRSSRGLGAFNRINKGTGFYSEYNLYDADASENIVYFYGQNQNLETTVGIGDETMSLLGDPMFRDAANGDFNLMKGSSAARKGIQTFDWDYLADGVTHFTITAPAIDYAGTSYSELGQDIGAYYTPYSLKTINLAGDGAGLAIDAGGNGSVTAPFRYFADALNAMDSADTIIVHKGIYTGRTDIYNLHGVADANCIIKACDDPDCAICKAADPDNALPGPVFTGKNDWTDRSEKVYDYETMSHMTNCSNVTVEGIYVTGFHGAGLWTDYCDNMTFKNLKIWDIDNPDPHNSGVEGLLLGSTTNSLFKDIDIWDIGQTILSQADHGIYAGHLENCTFDGIKVSNSPGGGFQFYSGDNYNIHSTGCIIQNCVFSESNMGLILCGIDGFRITNNTFYNSWNMDLYLDWNVRNTVFQNNIFANELVDGCIDPTWGNFVTPKVIGYQWNTVQIIDGKETSMIVDNTFRNNIYEYKHFPATCQSASTVSPIKDFMAAENAADTNNKYTDFFAGKVKFMGTIAGEKDDYVKAQRIFDNILNIKHNSDCVNKGISQFAPSVDILGQTRISNPDIGAYEAQKQ